MKRKNIKEIRKKISQGFVKYCEQCNKPCCAAADFAVFKWELERLPLKGIELRFYKHRGRGEKRNNNVEYVNIAKGCPFLNSSGCKLDIYTRHLDCICYPVYPTMKYKRDAGKDIAGMMVLRSCTYAEEIAEDKDQVNLVRVFWTLALENISKDDIKAWFGDKRNHWLDKNVIKVLDGK